MRSRDQAFHAAIDLQALARLQALGQRHRIDLLADAIEGFRRDAPALLEGLQAAVAADSALRLAWSARALGVRAGALGARRVVRLTRALELASQGPGPFDGCLPAIERLATACAQVASALLAGRERLGAASLRSVSA